MSATMLHSDLQAEFQHLLQGTEYEVVEAFNDYDKKHYPLGLRMIFVGAHFQALENALSLFFMIKGLKKQIRLSWRDEHQAEVCDHIDYFIDLPIEN